MAAGALQELCRCRRTAPPQLERRTSRNASAAERVWRGVDTDRRAEVPVVDPPESAAERADLLLPAAARPQCRAVVEARLVRGSLQLSVFGGRAAAIRGRDARGS